jgi:ribosomal-protein-alanine N-acetyltransferase
MQVTIPTLSSGRVSIRPIRPKDHKALERELMLNRSWLRQWEATLPGSFVNFDTKAGIRSLLAYARAGAGIPFVIEYDGEFIGQLNVSGIAHGSLSSAQLGYWVSERVAGNNVTPAAVALATDFLLTTAGLHRVEICIRPENTSSLRVVEKLGFRYEGLRLRYIHINGDWRDHVAFALTQEDVPEGVLHRWQAGMAPEQDAKIPAADLKKLASSTHGPR